MARKGYHKAFAEFLDSREHRYYDLAEKCGYPCLLLGMKGEKCKYRILVRFWKNKGSVVQGDLPDFVPPPELIEVKEVKTPFGTHRVGVMDSCFSDNGEPVHKLVVEFFEEDGFAYVQTLDLRTDIPSGSFDAMHALCNKLNRDGFPKFYLVEEERTLFCQQQQPIDRRTGVKACFIAMLDVIRALEKYHDEVMK